MRIFLLVILNVWVVVVTLYALALRRHVTELREQVVLLSAELVFHTGRPSRWRIADSKATTTTPPLSSEWS